MKILQTALLACSVFVLFAGFSFDDHHDWVLKKDEDGIKVYTRYSPGSNLKEVRVVNTVKSSLSAIVALLNDTKNYPQWIFACGEAQTLKLLSDREQYQYSVTKVPWPFSDRDVVTHFTVKQDSATNIVSVISEGKPDYIPAKEGRVRVEHFQSNYKLTPLDSGMVDVEFELYVDPGGNIPAWLINANIVLAPYNTSAAMITQLPKYQSVSYSFIKEK